MPNPKAAIRASISARPPPGASCSRTARSSGPLAMTTPATQHAIPTSCSAAGRSPCASPIATGTITAVDPIGAMTPIFPVARASKKNAREIGCARPAMTPQVSHPDGLCSAPNRKTAAARTGINRTCPSPATASGWIRRERVPPTKSVHPQIAVAIRGRRAFIPGERSCTPQRRPSPAAASPLRSRGSPSSC